MANDRGLPSVPQGMDRPLTVYLQNLHAYVVRLGGLARGASEAGAVRKSEANAFSRTVVQMDDSSVTASKIRDGAISTGKIADAAVTGAKIAREAVIEGHLAAGAVTAKAIAESSVSSRSIGPQAVGENALQDGSVTGAKLADGVVPTLVTGDALDGETVVIPGTWQAKPVVFIAGFTLPGLCEGSVRVGAENIRNRGAGWVFDAVARYENAPPMTEGEEPVRGTVQWVAFGHRGGL